jgi:hypothetical protein
MVVAHVAIKPSDISNELLPLISSDSGLFCALLQQLEVFALEVILEQKEKSGRFV